jgi:hypothetical protein
MLIPSRRGCKGIALAATSLAIAAGFRIGIEYIEAGFESVMTEGPRRRQIRTVTLLSLPGTPALMHVNERNPLLLH